MKHNKKKHPPATKPKPQLVLYMFFFFFIAICCHLIHLCANLSHFLMFLFSYMSYTKLFWTLYAVGTHKKHVLFPIATDTYTSLIEPASNNLFWANQLCSTTQSSGQLSCHDCFDSLVVFTIASSCSFFYEAVSVWSVLVTSLYLGLNPPLLMHVFCSVPHVELTVEEVFMCAVRWQNRNFNSF